MRMKPVATFLRPGIGHPDFLGCAGQIRFADALSADFIVVGVCFLEFAQMTTLQNLGFAPNRP
jgi:hypothetical protein